jgi:hypothetical protein
VRDAVPRPPLELVEERRGGWGWLLAVLVLAGGLGALWHFRERLIEVLLGPATPLAVVDAGLADAALVEAALAPPDAAPPDAAPADAALPDAAVDAAPPDAAAGDAAALGDAAPLAGDATP